MDQETFEAVIRLKEELSKVALINESMDNGEYSWWSFLTPDIKGDHPNGIILTDSLRTKFRDAVEETLLEIEKKIEEL